MQRTRPAAGSQLPPLAPRAKVCRLNGIATTARAAFMRRQHFAALSISYRKLSTRVTHAAPILGT